MTMTPDRKTLIGTDEFGFTPETFKAKLSDYVQFIKDELETPPTQYLWERQLMFFRQREFEFFEKNMENPQGLYEFVQTIFDQAKSLEENGASRLQVASTILQNHREKVLPLIGFIEYGMNTFWGYNLGQFLTTAQQSSENDPT